MGVGVVSVLRPRLRFRVQFICCRVMTGEGKYCTYSDATEAAVAFIKRHHWRGYEARIFLPGEAKACQVYQGIDSADADEDEDAHAVS